MRFLYAIAVLACLVPRAYGSPITYAVAIGTSSLTGLTGSLDFNFNPGPLGAQTAFIQVTGLSGGTPSGSAVLTGNASGVPPGTVTLTNGTAYNDLFEAYRFGSSLLFDVTLDGAALSAPNGTALSGSTFAFSIFSDAPGTIPALTSDAIDGYAITADVNLNGSTTVANYTKGSALPVSLPTAATPEPTPWVMVATGVLSAAGCVRRRLL